MHTPLTSLRERIVTQVRGMTRASGGLTLDIASPPGDPGLFGRTPSAGRSTPISRR